MKNSMIFTDSCSFFPSFYYKQKQTFQRFFVVVEWFCLFGGGLALTALDKSLLLDPEDS